MLAARPRACGHIYTCPGQEGALTKIYQVSPLGFLIYFDAEFKLALCLLVFYMGVTNSAF
jgi:hypothetical protein